MRRAVRRLTLEDLRLCQNPQNVVGLLERLGYTAALSPVAQEILNLSSGESSNVQAGYLLADHGDLQIFLFELNDLHSVHLRALAKSFLQRPGNYLLIVTRDYKTVIFVHPRRLLDEHARLKVKIHKLVVDTSNPTRHDLEVLEGLAADRCSPDALYQAHCEAFSVDRVTQRFYREYARLFEHTQRVIAENNRGVALFKDKAKLHAFTQRLLGRIMFLYFLQKKLWLAGDPKFLTNWYRRIVLYEQKNYYSDFLEKLFFETLNRRRPNDESPWGNIPYLNGGLFDKDYNFLLHLPNELFDPHSDQSILGFFNSYNFTVQEDTPLEADVALDPELLGKVFENMMESAEREESGTFYTPRQIVHFMCRTALTEYLADETKLPKEQIKKLFELEEDAKPELSVAEATQIERALGRLRVLDPAVGTAAFLVSMLHEMIALRRACERAKGAEVRVGSARVAEWKREYIANSLYGVDIKEEAIEIAKLRLWLSLVVDLERDQVTPLPNLDYKLMIGDSLIETLDGQPILTISSEKSMFPTETQRAIEGLHRLKEQFFEAGPEERAPLRRQIEEHERALVLTHIAERQREINAQIKNIGSRRDAKTGRLRREDEKQLEKLIEAGGKLGELEGKIKNGEALPFFLYKLHCAEVFAEKNGFDIVIANPPYVRQERLEESQKSAFKETFQCYHGMADLYVYFYERGFQLLRPNGLLTFISSNKFFRAGYGRGLREFLVKNATIQTIIDFGDQPVFDATAYPCVMIAKTRPPQDLSQSELRALTVTDIEALEHLEQKLSSDALVLKQSDLAPEGWRLESPKLLRLLEKIKAAGVPLGEYVQGKFYYGIKTGYNEAFVIDEATKEKLITEDPKSAEIIKPFLRGRDIKRWRGDFQKRYLIFTRRGIKINDYPAIKKHLAQYKERLMPGSGRKPGNYEWYEIQDTIDYYAEFEKPKIVWPNLCTKPKFAFDEEKHYINAPACIVIAPEPRYVLALLNSKLLFYFISPLAAQRRGSFLEFKPIYVEQLPIARASEKEKAQIEKLVAQILKDPDDPRVAAWEAEIDQIVYRLYGLSEEEKEMVEEWYAKRRSPR